MNHGLLPWFETLRWDKDISAIFEQKIKTDNSRDSNDFWFDFK